jgi:pimeloyl-ACP methyl ester carboxylesterase
MSEPCPDLLRRLATARSIPFRRGRLPRAAWMTASDGVKLHFLDWPGGAETLILLHGGMLSARTFDLLALALAPDVRCIALDLRGHGGSGWADTYTVERWAADVVELAGSLGLERLHLAGMSLGGCIAGYAAKVLGDRVASLTFIDVAAEVNFAATDTMRAFIENSGAVARVEDLVKQALAVSPRTNPALMLYRYQALLKPSPEGFVWRADRRHPVDFDHILGRLTALRDLAPRIGCPVLVIKGGRSQVLTEAALKNFAWRFPKGRANTIDDAGHNVQEDAPVALAATLRQMLSIAGQDAADRAMRGSA